MSSHISSHVNMAQNYYNDIQTQYQAIQVRNGAHAAPVNTVAGAVEYHRQNQNLEQDSKVKTCFSGAMDDFFRLEAPIILNNAFTQELWIYPEHIAGYGGILGTDAEPNRRTFTLFWENSHLYINVGNKSKSSYHEYDCPKLKLDVKKWSHIAFTFDQGMARFYLNGSECDSKRYPIDDLALDLPLNTIGKIKNYLFKGQIDDVRIWDIALTVDQIRADMFKSMPAVQGNLKFSHCSKKMAALTDHELRTSPPSALAAKATAIHALVMRMNDISAVADQRGNIEQLKSYVSQLSRIHHTFILTHKHLQLSFELQQKQAEVTAKNAQLAEKSNQIQTLTAQSTDLTNQLQDKVSQIATLQIQQQIQTTSATALGPQIELIRSVFQEQGADLRRQLAEKDQRIANLEAQLLQSSSQNSFMLQHVLQMQLTNQTNQPNLSMQTLVQLSSAPSLPPVFTSMGAMSIGSDPSIPQIAAQGHSNNTNTHNN